MQGRPGEVPSAGIRTGALSAALALLVCVMAAFPAGAEEPEPGAPALADQLRAAETAFARTMADRDLEAFTSFLAEDTVFFAGNAVLRGRQAVVAAWSRFFEGPEAPFAWAPEQVEVLESGALGFSTGPVLDPQGNRVGTFNSVWRREDGAWKIVFDRGCPPCP